MGTILFAICVIVDIPIMLAVCSFLLPTSEDWREAFSDMMRKHLLWRPFSEQLSALRLQVCLLLLAGLPYAELQAIHHYFGR